MSEKFGQYLRRRREAARLTQSELAGRVGVTPTYMEFLERGNDSMGAGQQLRPMLDVVNAIAGALGVPVTEVRRAAGYDPPEDFAFTPEIVERAFDRSDFAALHRMHEELDTRRRRIFRPVLDMVRRELELLMNEQEAEREVRSARAGARGRTQTFEPQKRLLGRTA